MSLLTEIKNSAKQTGSNLRKTFYVKDGEKRRVRFLTDFEDALKIPWVNCYDKNINCPNPEFFGKANVYANDPDCNSSEKNVMFLWQVYDYEANEVKLFIYKANQCSPVFSLANCFELYGTILDRDYIVSCDGQQQHKVMNVLGMDKSTFRQSAKKISTQNIKKILHEAYAKFSGDVGDDFEENAYAEMSAKELYNLCDDKGIEAEIKKPRSYYVALLEKHDEEEALENNYEEADWGEDGEEIDKYSSMTAKQVYDLCVQAELDPPKRKEKEFYIDLLKKSEEDKEEVWEEVEDEWADEEEDGWEDMPDPEDELPFQ